MDSSAQNRLSEISALIPPEKAKGFKRQADLDRFIEEKYSPDVLKTLQSSVKNQRSMLTALKEQGLNGQAESLERIYRVHTQELKRKETLLGNVWNGVTAPFRFIGKQFKEHPVRTTLIAALLVGGAYLYFSGTGAVLIANAQAWLAKQMGGKLLADAGGAAAGVGEKAGEALEGLKGAAAGGGTVTPPLPDYRGVAEELGRAARDLQQ